MIEIIPYEPAHLGQIHLQPMQAKYAERFVKPGYAESLCIPGKSWSARIGDRVLGSAGFSPQWEGRCIAWAIVGRAIPKRAWVSILNRAKVEMRIELEAQQSYFGHGRIEITVPYGFGAGCRLASALGFKIETLMAKFGPDGSDHFLYSRVA